MRHYTRKTNRATTPKEVVIMAVKGVVEDGNSYNSMATTYKIPKRSLVRYCRQYKNMKAMTDGSTSMQIKDISVGYEKCKRNRIFTSKDEDNLVQYIARYNDINSGLSYKQARKLTYQYAIATKIKVPPSWKKNMIAGEDWFCNFMKRHNTLNIRASETSLARATNFNHTTVGCFFDNLANIMTRFKLQPYNIWNMDETGVFIVEGANKVMGRHDVKQIDCLTSTEKGQFVTLVCTVSAYGNSIPPFFVFPTVCFEDNFINNGPVGCAGAVSPSGWIDENNFLLYLAHFVKYVRPSQNNYVLFLLNNNFYFSMNILDFAKDNGIIILSIPPNYSDRIHPFHIGISNSLKILINTAMTSWMISHPDKTVSIYDIPGIVRNILPMVLTPLNIMAGFENTGIYPLKQKAFIDADFVLSAATDRTASPQQENKIVTADGQNITNQPAVNVITFNNHDNDNEIQTEDAYCTNNIPVMSNTTTDNNNIITDDWKIDWNIIEITPDIQQISQNINEIIQEPQPSTSCEPMSFPVVEALSLDKEHDPLSKISIKNVRSLAKRQTQSITARTRKGRTSTSLTNEPIRDGVKKRKRKG